MNAFAPAALAEGPAALLTPNVVHVTAPFLPPLDEYTPMLEEIWRNRWLTNAGPFHAELETALAAHLGVEHLSLVSNGTTALILALQALRIGGEVITTPFSFVATAHAIRLAGATPVFVDVDPATGNLDPDRVAAAITSRTEAILPVHCFGQPCDTAAFERIATLHDLRLIYDAAHAFGVLQDGRSVLRHGDISTLSFHATKVFNTIEGGALVLPDRRTKDRIDRLRNFGFAGDVSIAMPGLNGKMNELQAAFGLLQLRYVDRSIATRGAVTAAYRAGLDGVKGIAPLAVRNEWTLNHAYFPVLIDETFPIPRDALLERLQAAGILARRYFHPLIADMPGYRELPSAAGLPIARRFAARVLCLPVHTEVTPDAIAATLSIIAAA